MSKKIHNKYYFSAIPLIAGIFLLPVIGLLYLSLALNPGAMEMSEPSKEILRLPQEQQEAVIQQQKQVAAVIGFANILPQPLNRLTFASISFLCFFWLYLLFRKFGKDGIALTISDDTLTISTYKGRISLKRSDIVAIELDSPSEIKFETRLGRKYLSTTSVKELKAQTLKDHIDAWMMKDYDLIEVSDRHILKPMDKLPDIHPVS